MVSKEYDIPGCKPDEELIGHLRRLAGPEQFDLGATSDKMGIFQLKDKHQHNMMGEFVLALHSSLFALEQNIALNKAEKPTDELSRVSQLITFFSRLTYLPSEAAERQKYLQRFKLEKHAYLYVPHSRSKHGTEIVPLGEYNFRTPAEIEYTISDNENRNKLVIGLFPVEHSFYRNRPDLVGASIPDARQTMTTQNGQKQGHYERMISALEEAQKTNVPPHIYLRLEDQEGDPISSIHGNLVENDTVAGFNLMADELASSPIFLPLHPARKTKALTPLPPAILMESFCKSLFPLQVKNPINGKNR